MVRKGAEGVLGGGRKGEERNTTDEATFRKLPLFSGGGGEIQGTAHENGERHLRQLAYHCKNKLREPSVGLEGRGTPKAWRIWPSVEVILGGNGKSYLSYGPAALRTIH